MIVEVTGIVVTLNIGPAKTPGGMKGPALTLRRDSCLLSKDNDVGHKTKRQMLTAYTSVDYDHWLKMFQEALGPFSERARISKFDTHYTLQFDLEFSTTEDLEYLDAIRARLGGFVARNFDAYDINEKD